MSEMEDADYVRKRRSISGRLGISSSVMICSIFAVFYFLFDFWILSSSQLGPLETQLQSERELFLRSSRPPVMYDRLLALAAHALAEANLKDEPADLWDEPALEEASSWKPCADVREPGHTLPLPTGYIVVNANGGLNQQRVAVCNAVAVARLLNATLVLPKFMLSNVWNDESQFGDIYQEDFFIESLKQDVNIVRELPFELQSLNLQAIGSFLSDADVMKEATPGFYLKHVLPILLQNRVVYFSGFGNRLSFHHIPPEIQRLRCRCNFHALKFAPKIQVMGNLLVQRMRERGSSGPGPAGKYLGLHLRFEIDMVAYSMCDFGGGEQERAELRAYRAEHFPLFAKYDGEDNATLAENLRETGQCPMTPEEAVLMLAALGYKRGTRIFVAGAHIYGGHKRMIPLASLYPNLVTKEDLMSSDELAPFANHSSQLAALDFIVSSQADVFAMTDSGSQLSSLVSGIRMYFGGGKLATIRPNKKRLANIFRKKSTILWDEFGTRVRKSIRETRRVQARPVGRSIYRHPRSIECMCKQRPSDKQD